MNNNSLLTLKAVWLALFSSIFIYIFLTVKQFGAISFSISMQPKIQIFYFIAVVIFLFAFILPKIMLKPLVQKFRSKSFNDAEIYKMYFVPAILKFSLLESISILGYVFSINTQDNIILPFVFLSFLGLLVSFPGKERIKAKFIR